jgi:D-alanine-D-alanine ligase
MASSLSERDGFPLRPTSDEVRNTHILYFGKNLEDPVEVKPKIESLRSLGFKITLSTDAEILLDGSGFGFIYISLIQKAFAGHELFPQALAAFRGVPCLGPPAPIRAISEDKVIGKMMAVSAGVDVAQHHVVNPRQPGISHLCPPGRWILKPRSGVMSKHIGFIDDASSWRKAVARASHPMHGGQDFLAEEFIPGLNLAVPVVEGLPAQALCAFIEHGEPRNNILTSTGKEGLSGDYLSEPYDGPGAAQAKAAAARMAATITPFDYARFDFRFEPVTNRLVFLEVNMVCAIGPYSVVSRAAARAGLDHPTLIGHVVAHSLRRQRKDG